MNKLQLIILILGPLFVTGCVTHQYQGDNFPSFSSPNFPSYSLVSEITDGITRKLPEASGKTKITMSFKLTKGQQEVSLSSNIDWKWDINVENNLIYNHHTMEMVLSAPDERKYLNLKLDGIHETSGKEIKIDIATDFKEDNFTVEELNRFKKQMSEYINYQFAGLGKKVKTGDVLRYIPNDFSDMKQFTDTNIQDEFPEVIKGLGVYKNKSVVVTEYIAEDSIHNPDFVMEVRGKGYNLYDAETFIHLFGEGAFYVRVFDPKEGTLYLQIDMSLEAQDLQIRNIIYSPNLTDKIAGKESNKSSWSKYDGVYYGNATAVNKGSKTSECQGAEINLIIANGKYTGSILETWAIDLEAKGNIFQNDSDDYVAGSFIRKNTTRNIIDFNGKFISTGKIKGKWSDVSGCSGHFEMNRK